MYSPEEVEESAKGMIGDFLITKQTGAEGRICNSVMVTERKYTRKEFYIAFMNERSMNGPCCIASSEGGVNIEEVAASNPDAIVKFPIDCVEGLSQAGAEEIATRIGVQPEKVPEVSQILLNLYKLFQDKDASMVEINPFAEDNTGNFVCLDAKLKFDDNADFRQKAVFDQRDWSQEDAREVEAANYNLNYIALDGDIGCMVNGAGLAMATMDIIKLHGGSPANFLDVGGGATADQVVLSGVAITSSLLNVLTSRQGERGFQNHHWGPKSERSPREHLRWDHEVRRDRGGHHRRRQGAQSLHPHCCQTAGGTCG